MLEECISRLIHDLTENPNILKKKYFKKLKVILQHYYIELFKDIHLQIFLKLENQSLKEAFIDRSLLEMNRDKTTFLSSLIGEIVLMKGFFVKILYCTKDPDFTGWKLYFILLNQYLLDNTDVGVTTRIKSKRIYIFFKLKKN